ncbi:thiamine pyrophosphate-dependent enzyme [Algoriphagus sp. AGSA1]|uniref:thiamine pyrophosphate-dependent enzyme n=1 Tax=Algoriphagus sp. AGSA1 TaxID=2907213 RepID=UPI001F1AB97C|nr:thiamine pyrophosphate-dependent enzyme [Algoriphagus sp. AGSA1]MCE7054678.1 thiamine pyrophosphate-dependent enzyme [Algoriphagus sp. AGSA1]
MKETDEKIHSKMNTADVLVQKLIDWDVKFIFGIIGDRINPIVEALRKRQQHLRFITVRHEESAAFMASGYAKYTGKLGVCLATSGPGVIHLMNGLYDAYKDHVPVLAITGAPVQDLEGTDYTQEVNVSSLMQEVTTYSQVITGPKQAESIVDLAIRAALNEAGVSHLNFAKDTQEIKKKEDEQTKEGNEKLKGSQSYQPRVEVPGEEALNSAAEIINSGKKIGILAGCGARTAREEVLSLAKLLGAPVTTALLGKGVIPDDSPYSTGGIGHLGTLPSKEWMQECDVLVILGSNMPYLEYYPKTAKAIQVDHNPKRIGLRYPAAVGLTGDVAATVKALLPKLDRKEDQSFLNKYQKNMEEWRKTLEKVEEGESELIRPQYLVAEVGRQLQDDATVSIDTGAHTVFTARHWEMKKDQQLAVSGNLASMAPGLPYALAAQLAFPDRQCVAMVGDGGFSMLMAEMATAVRYKLPVKVIIFKNNQLSQDVYEQKAAGTEVYGGDLTPIDFVKIAEACGAEGYTCSQKNQLHGILQQALSTSSPAVIEVNIDPDQAPSAPHHILENKF